MTNEEKFKTPEERIMAFRSWCLSASGRRGCDTRCHGSGNNERIKQMENKKIETCPYCGSQCVIKVNNEGDEFGCNRSVVVKCTRCAYTSCGGGGYNADAIAINNHNHVSLAVQNEIPTKNALTRLREFVSIVGYEAKKVEKL